MFFRVPKTVPFKNTEVYDSFVAFSKQNFHLGNQNVEEMKSWILLVACFSFACKNSSEKNKIPPKDSPVYYPYAPVHSNEFEKGNEKNAKKVLEIWRQYETGNILKNQQIFADSIRLILPDLILKGGREAVLLQYQKRRDALSDLQCFVYAWLPVHTRDTGEDLVYIWGLYDGTRKNGDRDYARVHEIWRFDKEGKITEMEQFRTHPH